ncbi:hypothetical protein Tco_0169710 [Tanacetum coccineum]
MIILLQSSSLVGYRLFVPSYVSLGVSLGVFARNRTFLQISMNCLMPEKKIQYHRIEWISKILTTVGSGIESGTIGVGEGLGDGLDEGLRKGSGEGRWFVRQYSVRCLRKHPHS